MEGPSLLRTIEPGTRYQTRVGHHHCRLVCRRCGSVADVDCAAGHASCLEPVTRLGYAIDEAQVTFWGLCANCRAAGPAGRA